MVEDTDKDAPTTAAVVTSIPMTTLPTSTAAAQNKTVPDKTIDAITATASLEEQDQRGVKSELDVTEDDLLEARELAATFSLEDVKQVSWSYLALDWRGEEM